MQSTGRDGMVTGTRCKKRFQNGKHQVDMGYAPGFRQRRFHRQSSWRRGFVVHRRSLTVPQPTGPARSERGEKYVIPNVDRHCLYLSACHRMYAAKRASRLTFAHRHTIANLYVASGRSDFYSDTAPCPYAHRCQSAGRLRNAWRQPCSFTSRHRLQGLGNAPLATVHGRYDGEQKPRPNGIRAGRF